MGKYGYEMKTIEPAEFEDWLAKARVIQLKVMLVVLYYTGIRIGEALSLRPQDITNTEDGYIHIDALVFKNKKMQGKRRALDIPLSVATVNLKEYALHRQGEGYHTIFDYGKRWFEYRFKELSPELSPHRFRHNRLSRLAESGVDSYAIRDWAGHSDTRPASAYIQVSGILARNAARKVDIT